MAAAKRLAAMACVRGGGRPDGPPPPRTHVEGNGEAAGDGVLDELSAAVCGSFGQGRVRRPSLTRTRPSPTERPG